MQLPAPAGAAVPSELVWSPPTNTYPPSVNGWYVAEFCTAQQWWFNMCIKAFTIIFSYINFLPVPWRLSILWHASSERCRAACRGCG